MKNKSYDSEIDRIASTVWGMQPCNKCGIMTPQKDLCTKCKKVFGNEF